MRAQRKRDRTEFPRPDLPSEAEVNRRKQQLNLRLESNDVEALEAYMRKHGLQNRNDVITRAIYNLIYG